MVAIQDFTAAQVVFRPIAAQAPERANSVSYVSFWHVGALNLRDGMSAGGES
jgi:hypothetical protein